MTDRPRMDAFRKLEQQVAALKAAAPFAHLDAREIVPLARRARLRRVRAGAIVCPQGERARDLFVVSQGSARAAIYGRNGREMTVDRFVPGDTFGEQAILEGRPHAVTYVAEEGLTLVVVDAGTVRDLLRSDPRAALALATSLATRLRRGQRRLAEVALDDVTTRLVRALGALAEARGEVTPDGVLIRHRPTQQELANQVGTCRETISRCLSALARRGLLRSEGRTLLLLPPLFERHRAAA